MATSGLSPNRHLPIKPPQICYRGPSLLPPGQANKLPVTSRAPLLQVAPLERTHPNNGRDRLVVELLPLVRRVALRMRERLPAHIEVDDLVGAGAVGLVEAVRRFDASKHVKLESYAQHRIRGAIIDGLRGMDVASRDLRKKNKKVEEAHRALERKLARPVSDAEMADALGMSLARWYRTAQELQAVGIDWLRPIGSVGTKQLKEEVVAAADDDNAFDRCYRREQKEILERVMPRLPERERLIVSLYYTQALTMKQIAARLGIDESRVSQLHSAALRRLRTRVAAVLRRSPLAVPAIAAGKRSTPPIYNA